MADEYNKDNLEDLFKDGLEGLSNDPAENGWDLPSDAVWGQVDARLRPKKDRRRLLWWMFGLGLLVASIWAIRLGFNDEYSVAKYEGQSEVRLDKNANGDTKANRDHNDQKQEGLAAAEEESNISKPERTSGSEHTSEGQTFVVDGQSQKRYTNNQPEVSSNGVSAQGERSGNNKKRNEDITIETIIEAKPFNENKTPASLSNGELGLENLDSIGQYLPSNTEQIPDTLAMKRKIVQTDLLPFLPLKQGAIEYTNEDELPPLSIKENDWITKPKTNLSGFYVGTEVTLIKAYRKIEPKNGFLIPRFYEDEEPEFSLGYGVKIGYQFSKNWSIETGLNRTSSALRFRSRRQIRYTMVDEMPNDQGEFQGRYAFDFNTSSGTVESDIALARSASTNLVENDFVGLLLEGQQNFEYLNVPIIVRYHFGQSRWQLGLKAGIVNRFLQDATFQFESISTSRDGVRLVVEDRFFRTRPLDSAATYQADFTLGAGLRFWVTNQLSLMIEPSFSRSINPFFEGDNFKTFPTIQSLDFGATWRF